MERGLRAWLRILAVATKGNQSARDQSGGGVYDEREIVDTGFLELVRLEIKAAAEPLVLNSVSVVDKTDQDANAGWRCMVHYRARFRRGLVH